MGLDIFIAGQYISFRINKYLLKNPINIYLIPTFCRHPLNWLPDIGDKDLYFIRWLIFEIIYRDYQQRKRYECNIIIN